MGRGRPRRAAQRLREEEINHGISSSNKEVQAAMRVVNVEQQLQTPEGPPQILMTVASKDMGKK